MLDFLIRNWIQNTARQRVYEAARQAAFDQLGQSAQSSSDEAPSESPRERPVDVGVVFALDIEAGSFEDRLDGVLATHAGGLTFRSGGLRGRHVAFVASGAGHSAARKAAELLISGHHPQWVICAGFAGGLDPALARGDFVMATEVANIDALTLSIDLKLPVADASRKPRVHGGKLLSVPAVVRTLAEKQSLAKAHGAAAVDLETFAVAQVCQQEKTRFLSVRIVSDACNDELPREIQRLATRKTSAARWGAALGAIVNRPSSLKDMLEQKEQALVHADALAKFLEGVILQLAPPQARQTSP